MEHIMTPLCFILMPFGDKPDGSGGIVDFDAVYRLIIDPAVRASGLDPIRADQEQVGGIIHKPMFERLILCDVAVADLTTANANVFYELGIRHAVRPFTTVSIFAEGHRLPFDVNFLRSLPYHLKDGRPSAADDDRKRLEKYLIGAINATHQAVPDSPIYQLVPNLHCPQIDHLRTDVFRDLAHYAEGARNRLAKARTISKQAGALRDQDPTKAAMTVQALALTDAVRDEWLPSPGGAEAGVLIDLLLTYRALSSKDGYRRLIALVEAMPETVKRTVLVQEQYGFALNRIGNSDEAERILRGVINSNGPSSETLGLLGRVYKDRWDAARKAGDTVLARGFLKQAIETYLHGFQTDWRDAYPGVNAATLMEIANDPRRLELIPAVRYAVERKIARGNPDYWDFATRFELAVLAQDQTVAETALADALALLRESWEAGTTANNLRLMREARSARGLVVTWANKIEHNLSEYSG